MSKAEFTISDAPSSEMQMKKINLDIFSWFPHNKYISGADWAKYSFPATGIDQQCHTIISDVDKPARVLWVSDYISKQK